MDSLRLLHWLCGFCSFYESDRMHRRTKRHWYATKDISHRSIFHFQRMSVNLRLLRWKTFQKQIILVIKLKMDFFPLPLSIMRQCYINWRQRERKKNCLFLSVPCWLDNFHSNTQSVCPLSIVLNHFIKY